MGKGFSRNLDKLFDDYKVRMLEHDKKINEAWKEINRRRKKLTIGMLILWVGLVGLGYYLSH